MTASPVNVKRERGVELQLQFHKLAKAAKTTKQLSLCTSDESDFQPANGEGTAQSSPHDAQRPLESVELSPAPYVPPLVDASQPRPVGVERPRPSSKLAVPSDDEGIPTLSQIWRNGETAQSNLHDAHESDELSQAPAPPLVEASQPRQGVSETPRPSSKKLDAHQATKSHRSGVEDLVNAFESEADAFQNNMVHKVMKLGELNADEIEEQLVSFSFTATSSDYLDIRRPKAATEAPQKRSRDDTRLEHFEACKGNGYRFPVRGGSGNPMGGHWQRALESDPKLKSDYAASEKKDLFRSDWAERTHKEYSSKSTHTQSIVIAHEDKGQYLAPGRIAWKEGGGKQGWKNTVNIVCDANRLGGKWIWTDRRAQASKYLYFVKGMSEKHEEAWTIHKEWKQEIIQNQDESEPEEDPMAKPKGKAKGKSKQAAKAKGKAKGNATSPGKNEPTTASDQLKAAAAAAKTLKLRYQETTTTATTFIAQISSHKDYKWMLKRKMGGKVSAALKKLHAVVQPPNDFAVRLFAANMTELNTLVKSLDISELTVSLAELEKQIMPFLNKVEQTVTKLQSQHEAEMDAQGTDSSSTH